MNNKNNISKTADLFNALGKPVRLRILLAIGEGEACVCHLESELKKRQAYLSQQLMTLREAGLLETRREGKYVFYRLNNPDMLDMVKQAAVLAGISPDDIEAAIGAPYQQSCCCPHCEAVKSTQN